MNNLYLLNYINHLDHVNTVLGFSVLGSKITGKHNVSALNRLFLFFFRIRLMALKADMLTVHDNSTCWEDSNDVATI